MTSESSILIGIDKLVKDCLISLCLIMISLLLVIYAYMVCY